MKHLRRAAAVLVAVLLFVFVVPRIMPVEEALQPLGFYRGGDDIQVWKNRPMSYVDTARCNACHSDKYAAWQQAAHRTVSCETCHGPGGAHIETLARPVVDRSRDFCAVCHDKLISRPAAFPQVNAAQHGGQSNCTTCHNAHSPQIGGTGPAAKAVGNTAAPASSKESTLPRVPHTLDGRADCLLCHNTGGLKPFPDSHAGRTSSTCLSCHGSQ